ncbi:VRR-Nuc domain protein [Pseudomonas phage DDSR119]|nr:VRR-Nuc domain protein [Pseudomonas phage DDSR119]
MKPLEGIKHFGNLDFRDKKCPLEVAEQVTFFNQLRKRWPETWGRIALHARNEGKKRADQVAREKAEGMATGAADVTIPGNPAFLCELKRKDRTLSALQPDQEPYLRAADAAGAFVCIAFGWEAGMEAFEAYLDEHYAGWRDEAEAA